jgi:hypothetical protein
MALKKDTSFEAKGKFTVNVNQAYIRVQEVTGSKEKCSALVYWFKDENSEEPFNGSQHLFAPDMTGGNFIKQAYGHLKTLPEFAGATDC